MPAALPNSAARPFALVANVSLYDRVSGWIITLLLFVGLCVLGLLAIWYSHQIVPPVTPAVPVVMQELAGGTDWGEIGASMPLDSPVDGPITPATERHAPTLERFAAVADAVSTQEALLVDPDMAPESASSGSGRLRGAGSRIGRGKGEGVAGYPRSERWEIRFAEGRTLEEYARQLDAFAIELGAVGAGREVHYASQLSASKPQARSAPRAQESRLYMSWRQGRLKDADRTLLERAGISTSGKVLVQFFPAAVENTLAGLEKQYRGVDADRIRKTVFGVRPRGRGYEFFVIEQHLLAPQR